MHNQISMWFQFTWKRKTQDMKMKEQQDERSFLVAVLKEIHVNNVCWLKLKLKQKEISLNASKFPQKSNKMGALLLLSQSISLNV